MRIKILGFLAAVSLVAACESSSQMAGSGGADTMMGDNAGGQLGYQVENFSPDPMSQDYLDINIGDKVYFDFDKYTIRDDYVPILEAQAQWMKQYPSVQVVIGGYCDERGTREYNLALGARRANSVKDFLVASGVNPDRILTISYGKERPAVPGSTEAAHAANRRAVTFVQ